MSAGGRLAGKRALVTGAGSGIGAEIARRFAQEGAAVVTADLRGGDLDVDVRSRASVEAGVDEAVARLGGLDTLVCNAGRPIVGTVADLDEAEWDDGLATDLKSIYLCTKAAWPQLLERGGSITVTASTVGIWATENQAAYCAAKAAAIMLAKCLALDGAKAGIRANAVCPGFTATPMLERFMAEQPDPEASRAAAVRLHPLGRLGTALDMADAFVYLASDEASWVTGHALAVDGGFSVGLWER